MVGSTGPGGKGVPWALPSPPVSLSAVSRAWGYKETQGDSPHSPLIGTSNKRPKWKCKGPWVQLERLGEHEIHYLSQQRPLLAMPETVSIQELRRRKGNTMNCLFSPF